MSFFSRTFKNKGTTFLNREGSLGAPKGFTLIEFVVILSIFAIMAAVALANFKGFNNDVALNNLAQDIALTIRQAQVFGWSTTSQDTGNVLQLDANGNPLRYADGVYLGYGHDTPNAFDSEFSLYTKVDSTAGNEYYNSSQPLPDTLTDTVSIKGTAHISLVCEVDNANDEQTLTADPHNSNLCSGTTGTVLNNGLSIAFSRPRPEALFFQGDSSLPNTSSALTGVQFINIYVSATGDPAGVARHMITVSSIGEIAVQ